MLVVSACIIPQSYRTASTADCATTFIPDRSRIYENPYHDPSACPVRTYATLADGDPALPENRYLLAFQEFDTQGRANAEQELAIRKILTGDRPKFVIMYVHGWRHNAAVGNEDVRRFHTLLGYSRSFLNQRRGRYPDIDLIGIYVGWYGKAIREPPSSKAKRGTGVASGPTLDQIVAGPSFPLIKSISDRISPSIHAKLKEYDDLVRPGMGQNRVLVIGHSTGGNILATGMEGDILEAISRHEPGGVMASTLGDLTALINPASEAAKWVSIQEAMRTKAGAQGDEPDYHDAPLWNSLFSPAQRPTYISFTTGKNWSKSELQDRDQGDVLFDSATYKWFRLSQSVFGRAGNRLDKNHPNRVERNRYAKNHAIGHVLPTNIRGVAHPLGRFGSTHELTSYSSRPQNPTGFANLAHGDTECVTADGWLNEARRIHYAEDKSGNWDSVYGPNASGKLPNPLTAAPARDKLPAITLQLRRGITITDDKGGDRSYRSVIPLNAPYWNIRVYDQVIEEHGNYVNHGFFCLLNQLVLDEPTGAAPAQ